jgi:TolA-binding protein
MSIGFVLTLIAFSGCVSTDLVQTMLEDIQRLKSDVADLKTQVEDQSTEIEILKKDIVENREKTSSPSGEEVSDDLLDTQMKEETRAAVPEVENAEMLYSKGQDLYHSGNYREASMILEEAAALSETDALKARCYYWVGECFFAQNTFDRALEYFTRVFTEFDTLPKSEDAQLKIGFTYYELKEYNKAVQVLEDFLIRYPNHRAVNLAQAKLDTIGNLLSDPGNQPNQR